MKSIARWQHLAAAILLAHTLSACGGANEVAPQRPSATASPAAASSPTAAAKKADPEVRFAP